MNKNKISKNYVQFIQDKNRKIVDYMLSKMSNHLDVIIPRGGKKLVRKIQTKSKVPTIGHLEGICHIFVDKEADLKTAIKVVNNSKLRKTSSCGALETLLIDKLVKANPESISRPIAGT